MQRTQRCRVSCGRRRALQGLLAADSAAAGRAGASASGSWGGSCDSSNHSPGYSYGAAALPARCSEALRRLYLRADGCDKRGGLGRRCGSHLWIIRVFCAAIGHTLQLCGRAHVDVQNCFGEMTVGIASLQTQPNAVTICCNLQGRLRPTEGKRGNATAGRSIIA